MIVDDTGKPSNEKKLLVSKCCLSPDMIEPDWEMAERAGSMWRAYACYICRKCGEACYTVEIDAASTFREPT